MAAPSVGISVAAPSSFIEGGVIFLEGEISARNDESIEYLVLQDAGIYAQPSQRRLYLLEVVPPRTVVKGSEPSRTGWIQLEGGHWILADAVKQLSPPRAPARRFVKHVNLPEDALLNSATEELRDNEYVVTVPRQRKTPAFSPAQSRASSQTKPPPAPSRPSVSPTAAADVPSWIHHIRSECFAEDIKVPPMAKTWSEEEVRAFFESGGKQWPTRGTPSKVSNPGGLDIPATKAARTKTRADGPSESTRVSEGLPKSDPVLTEVAANAANVQAPEETCQYWDATGGGGFAPAPDM